MAGLPSALFTALAAGAAARLCAEGTISERNGVCCPTTCGFCGGHGCKSDAADVRERCCPSAIYAARRCCKTSGDVACALKTDASQQKAAFCQEKTDPFEGFDPMLPATSPPPEALLEQVELRGVRVRWESVNGTSLGDARTPCPQPMCAAMFLSEWPRVAFA